jgi:hypothetical protein
MNFKRKGSDEWKLFYSANNRSVVEKYFKENKVDDHHYQMWRKKKVIGEENNYINEMLYNIYR